MGGLWEAGIKSFKTLFYKSITTRKYTFKELSTLLARIEACLNHTFNPNIIQLIWLLEEFPFKSWWITRFGGMDPLGCNVHAIIGPAREPTCR